MTPWYKVEKDGTVHGHVPSHADANYGQQTREAHKVVCCTCRQTEHTGDEEREVEGEAATPDVGAQTPEERTDEETNVDRE